MLKSLSHVGVRARTQAARFALAFAGGLALSVSVAPSFAQGSPAAESNSTDGLAALGGHLEQQVRQLALDGSRTAAPGAPRIEVVLGQLDARLRLAPCARIEPYLPEGTRPWGKSRIGLRCTEGAVKWNVYLPITVKAFAPGWVATANASAGSTLAAADLAQGEVDLAEDASAPLLHADAAVGRQLARPIKAGQGVRLSHLKPRQWFTAGDTVTVLSSGAGFSVAGEAQALTNGVEGQPARVRTDSGRVLSGVPVGDKRLELAL